MKNKEAVWAIQRTHKVTGAVSYLSPGEVNWIPPDDHEKYGTRYGRWVWGEAEEITGSVRKKNYVDFDYLILLHEKIK
jgi:hypothetical protein